MSCSASLVWQAVGPPALRETRAPALEGIGSTSGAGGVDSSASSGSGTSGGGGSPTTSGGSGSSGTGGPDVDASTTGNPFAGATMFINPDYVAEVEAAIAMDPADAPLLKKVEAFSTAIWLDRIAMVPKVEGYLDKALVQQAEEGKPVVSVFVIYDLPNRDCHAKASNGELHVESGGVQTYKTDYIDKIAAVFKAHSKQRIVALVEPDSLPNLATNLGDPKCVASEAAYRESVAYAIKTLAAPNVFMYLDAAHSGWLGWPDNQKKAATIFQRGARRGRRPWADPRLRLQYGQLQRAPRGRRAVQLRG